MIATTDIYKDPEVNWQDPETFFCIHALTVLDNIIDRVLSISESNDITIIMLSAEWTVLLIFLVQSVPMVRLECSDGALLRAQCSSVSMVRCELK